MFHNSFCFETARKYAFIQSKKILNGAAHVRPNITGKTPYGVFQPSAPDGFKGALNYFSRNGNGNIISGGNYWTAIDLDASKDNAIYSASSIQPISGYSLMIIKE